MPTVKEEVRGMLDKQRLTTFVLGGIAGALAGILLAPKSGKELRGSVAARAGEARERGRETYFEAQERMQERLAESREHQLRSQSTRSEQAAEAISALGLEPELEPEPEPVLGHEPPSEVPPPGPLPLRDVSWDVSRPESGEDPDPEEIRRKIQETRSRLRSRLDSTEPEDAPGEQDA
jgi:gas vesicle protein